MNSGDNNQLETIMLEYDQLLHPGDLNQDILGKIDMHIKGSHWSASYQCITMIRSLCKYYPQHIMDFFGRYGMTLLDLFNHATTLLMKNILKLLRQTFNQGQNINLQNCVVAFLPILIKKSANQSGYIKEANQQILTIIANNCCYVRTIQGNFLSYEVITEFSCDKVVNISQIAIKLLSVIIMNIGGALTQINPGTLQLLMKGMSLLINGKRNNMKTSALDICIFIYSQIGSQNYLQLMNYSLNQSEIMIMGQSMQTHRTQKNKGPQLADILKQQKMQNTNYRQSCQGNNNWGQNIR